MGWLSLHLRPNERHLSMRRAELQKIDEASAVPARVRHELLMVLKESLTNIGKHAAARNVTVALALNNGDVHLAIKDDGEDLIPPSTSRRSLWLLFDCPFVQGLPPCAPLRSKRRAIYPEQLPVRPPIDAWRAAMRPSTS